MLLGLSRLGGVFQNRIKKRLNVEFGFTQVKLGRIRLDQERLNFLRNEPQYHEQAVHQCLSLGEEQKRS